MRLVIAVGDDGGTPPGTRAAGGAPAPATGETMLVIGTRAAGADERAVWMSLVSFDPAAREGAIAYVPVHTAAEVPGRGLRTLADAFSSGGVPLLRLSAEPVLDVRIDSYVVLPEARAGALFAALGPLTVDVPSEVLDGDDPVLPQGLQVMDAESLTALLYARGTDDDDLDVSSRHVAFWDALFERYRPRPQALEDAVTSAGAALERSDASPVAVAHVLEGIARLGGNEPALEPFPVARVGAGTAELYSAAPGEVDAFVERNLGSVARAPDEVRVQVLNGNGAPGIGQEVAEALVGEGFRVVLAGNARRFDYRHTLVVTYDASPAGRALARRAAEALGVGRVRVSGAGQGIVDLTIVVGKDFLRES